MVYIRIALFLLLISLFSPSVTFAQSLSATIVQEEESVSTDPAVLDEMPVEETSEYVLPYPGMLPTNPLYFLKNLRDNFIGFIISDPLKKAEFELLQADKKLASAQFLLKEDKTKIEQSLSSVEESSIHMKTAFDKLTKTDVKSTDSQALFQKMAASLEKHSQILTNLSESTRNDAFSTHAKKTTDLQKKAESYL